MTRNDYFVPQVFRAGDPVDRCQESFIRRDGLLGDLNRQLTLAGGCPGLVLYGCRRMGKSTLRAIKQL
jgi:predicted AAA+ superfamily ATPase